MSASDAVDSSTTGTRVPRKWVFCEIVWEFLVAEKKLKSISI